MFCSEHRRCHRDALLQGLAGPEPAGRGVDVVRADAAAPANDGGPERDPVRHPVGVPRGVQLDPFAEHLLKEKAAAWIRHSIDVGRMASVAPISARSSRSVRPQITS